MNVHIALHENRAEAGDDADSSGNPSCSRKNLENTPFFSPCELLDQDEDNGEQAPAHDENSNNGREHNEPRVEEERERDSGDDDVLSSSSDEDDEQEDDNEEETLENTSLIPPSQPIPFVLPEEQEPEDPEMEFYRAVVSVKARHNVSDAAIDSMLKVFGQKYPVFTAFSACNISFQR